MDAHPSTSLPGEKRSEFTPASAQQVCIRARNVRRSYVMGSATIPAVDDVSLEVAAREFAALLGPSGSGKSTLLHLLAGLDRPTSGSIEVAGQELARLSSEELARYRRHTVGMVFQAFNLIPTMPVFENVELPLRLSEVDRTERRARVEEALETVHLSARGRHRPMELSGGEQQRVALARALVNRPSLLLADEPTGNLDSRTGQQIMELIAGFNQERGMTVVLVTHERSLAERFARRMIYMADGKVQESPNGQER